MNYLCIKQKQQTYYLQLKMVWNDLVSSLHTSLMKSCNAFNQNIQHNINGGRFCIVVNYHFRKMLFHASNTGPVYKF